MTTENWKSFLQQWSDEWLARDNSTSKKKKSRWLGSKPATEKQLATLEKRLGYQLPPSYRNFLLTTSGWFHTSSLEVRIRPAAKVEWLRSDQPELLDVWNESVMGEEEWEEEEYFSYDGRPIFKTEHLNECLIIAHSEIDSMIYLLNPLVVAEDGEWEAWRFANWIPGAERFPSFEKLMFAEYQLFHAEGVSGEVNYFGPFDGIYAPKEPRTAATKLGNGKPKPRRLTIPELINDLESSDKGKRLNAAKHLLREFCPHDPAEEHPELVSQLSRIAKSNRETHVRCAAVGMLGSYGTVTAVPPLIEALRDPELLASALGALFCLCFYYKDSQIADAMIGLLESSTNYFVLDKALSILSELNDARLESVSLRLLDHAHEIGFDDLKGANDPIAALEFRISSLQMAGAFAYVESANNATPALIGRLTSKTSGIRAAVVAALRKDPKRGPHLAINVKPLLKDPDANVQMQASTTLGFLKRRPEVKVSATRINEVVSDVEEMIRSRAARKKSRF